MKLYQGFIIVLLFWIAVVLTIMVGNLEYSGDRISGYLRDISIHQQCPRKPIWCTSVTAETIP
jgi:hypothetical protein